MHNGQVADSNRHAFIRLNDRIADLLDGFFFGFPRTEKAFAANEVFHPGSLSGFRTDFGIGGFDRHQQFVQRDVVVAQLVRIDFDLILANVASDGSNFRNAIDGFEGQLDDVVLQRSQVGEVGIRCRFQHVVENLTESRRIRPQHGRNAFGDFARR